MNDSVKAFLAILAIVVSIWFFKDSASKQALSQDFPDGTHWICLACKHEFSMGREDVADWNTAHPETTVPCPQCEENRSVRASKCPLPECGKHYTSTLVEINGEVCCPICKKAVP